MIMPTYEIYWNSGPQVGAGSDNWYGPLVSPNYPPTNGLSITRQTVRGPQYPTEPWAQGDAIIVNGVAATIITTPAAPASCVIGQAGATGPDMLFYIAGYSTAANTLWLPDPGILMPTLMTGTTGPNTYFDVYAAVPTGINFSVLASIFYIVP